MNIMLKTKAMAPSLPVFITPGILNVLVEKFNIIPIKTADEDFGNHEVNSPAFSLFFR